MRKKKVSFQQLNEIRAYVLSFGCYAKGEMTLKEASIYFDLLVISEGSTKNTNQKLNA